MINSGEEESLLPGGLNLTRHLGDLPFRGLGHHERQRTGLSAEKKCGA